MYDICIIGGGASGMTAAITAKEMNPTKSVIIVEKNDQLGRKILATGNGRCNLSNINCEEVNRVLQFFSRLGIYTRRDNEGRVYPYTEDAKCVNDALISRIKKLQIKTLTGVAIKSINFDENFRVNDIMAKKVLIACGGKAGSAFGTTGDGYKLAKNLGHSVNKPIPVLTAVELKEDMSKLAGIRAKSKVVLYYKNFPVYEEKGEVQFTKTGVSGICIFNLSRYLIIPGDKSLKDGFDDYTISIDFLPEIDNPLKLIEERSSLGIAGPKLLSSLVREPIANNIFDRCNSNIDLISKELKNFRLHPNGVKGWDFAQATKGGIPLSEINMDTMESNIMNNLYFAGEIIDYDGPCGGYNLQNAWITGIRAGTEMTNV